MFRYLSTWLHHAQIQVLITYCDFGIDERFDGVSHATHNVRQEQGGCAVVQN
jgi:hypothetical protein